MSATLQTTAPLQLYGQALQGRMRTAAAGGVRLRFKGGSALPLPIDRYLGLADRGDLELLGGVGGPVLDVGCGPGRHLRALSARGVSALGVDLSPAAVALAQAGGGRAVVGDVFGELPGVGSWQTALLLDGNVGIGGNPERLLARVRDLLAGGGIVLAEVEAPGAAGGAQRARIETDEEASAWFPWGRLSASEVGAVAVAAGLSAERVWTSAGRWFARLQR